MAAIDTINNVRQESVIRAILLCIDPDYLRRKVPRPGWTQTTGAGLRRAEPAAAVRCQIGPNFTRN